MDIMNALVDMQKAVMKYQDTCNQCATAYAKEFKEEYEMKASDIVTTWYDDYDPHLYDRYGDLYNIYKVEANEKSIIVYIGPDTMEFNHHQSNDLVYEVTAEKGYHGGSWSKKRSSIKYREPPGIYSRWKKRVAVKGFSLEEDLVEAVQEIGNRICKKYQQIIDEALVELRNRINTRCADIMKEVNNK